MIPSEDKARAMLMRVMRALEKEPGVRMTNPDDARRAVKGGIDAGIELLRGVDAIAVQKIRSLSRRVAEGTREWDELYAKYVSEERKRRGL